MRIEQFSITFHTQGRGSQDITAEVKSFLAKATIKQGLCHLFLKHTSASLMLCENYDPQVRRDLEHFLIRLVPDGDPLFNTSLKVKMICPLTSVPY